MKKINVVYMGTPDFAVLPLKLLNEIANVVLVVTKKDAYVGRKKVLSKSPVKLLAEDLGLEVFTPDNIKEEYQVILDRKPDLIVTCAYGKIIPKVLIDYPKYGCVNIHASLLPKYRGAAPIQWALMNGEKETGVTLMYMDEFMDTGDIIDTITYQIKELDDVSTLHDKLSSLGRDLLAKNFPNLISGNVTRVKQDDSLATYAKMIDRSLEELDFNTSVINVYNKIRAFSPWPLCKTKVFDEEIKVIKAHYEVRSAIVNKVYVDKNSLGIGCIDGIIYFDYIKPIGKKEMAIKDYLNGKSNI